MLSRVLVYQRAVTTYKQEKERERERERGGRGKEGRGRKERKEKRGSSHTSSAPSFLPTDSLNFRSACTDFSR